MKFIRTLVALLALFPSIARAQNAGTVTNNAFAIGKGPGTAGYRSVLCTAAQLPVGQAAAPICRTVTGDVTIDVNGVTTIGANKVTNSQLATAADGTIKSNISGGVAAPIDNTISAVLDKLLGTTRGAIAYRGVSAWAALAPGTSGFALKSNGPGADPSYQAGGTGTVTSVGLTNTYGLVVTGSPVTGSGNLNAELNITRVTNSLGADVALNNTTNYFDGPSVAQGTTGTWFASGTVTLNDSAGAASNFFCKLWDGTTVIASTNVVHIASASIRTSASLSGFLASPAANIRISCRNVDSTTAVMEFNRTSNSKDSTVTAIRLQ